MTRKRTELAKSQPTGLLREVLVAMRRGLTYLQAADESNDPFHWHAAAQGFSHAMTKFRQLREERERPRRQRESAQWKRRRA